MRRSIQFTHMYARQRAFENTRVFYSVMTRFNVVRDDPRMAHHQASEEAYRHWLVKRIALFRHYCMAPMLNQTIKPHAWFVMFDRQVTPEISTLLDELLDHNWIVPLLFGEDWMSTMQWQLRQVADRRFGDKGFTHSCCVRLDSDDSLNRCFMAAIANAVLQLREELEDQEPMTINFPYGALHLQGNYFVEHQVRQFFGIYESFERLDTPYRHNHRMIDQLTDVYDIFTPQPMFIYRAHDANISDLASRDTNKRQPFGNVPLLLAQFGLEA